MLIKILFYFMIFAVKVLEVTLATTRIVLITKGEKVKGAIIGFFEVIIWLLLVSTVLTNITEDPVKLVIYALGFALGNYVGSSFEAKLGFGTMRIEAIVNENDGVELVSKLRNHGFAVTVLKGEGKDFNRHVLIMHVKRKRHNEIISLIKECQKNVVITINEVKPIYGGYGLVKK